jgi:hypothetical protein
MGPDPGRLLDVFWTSSGRLLDVEKGFHTPCTIVQADGALHRLGGCSGHFDRSELSFAAQPFGICARFGMKRCQHVQLAATGH